jgi:hypothetical protein
VGLERACAAAHGYRQLLRRAAGGAPAGGDGPGTDALVDARVPGGVVLPLRSQCYGRPSQTRNLPGWPTFGATFGPLIAISSQMFGSTCKIWAHPCEPCAPQVDVAYGDGFHCFVQVLPPAPGSARRGPRGHSAPLSSSFPTGVLHIDENGVRKNDGTAFF